MTSLVIWRISVVGLVLLLYIDYSLAQRFRSSVARSSPRSGCLVIAPNEFHLNEQETVWITVPQTPHSQVNVELVFDDGNRRFGRVDKTIGRSENSKRVGITLRDQDLSRGNVSPKLHLVAKCNGREAVRTSVKVSNSKNTVLIQTDKPIYTPKQKVLIRVFTLNRKLTPEDFPFYVDVINPQGVIVQRDKNPPDVDDDVNSNNAPGIFHSDFQFPPFPMFGEWQVVVNYGKNYALREKSIFVVEEYDLPKFSVELNVDMGVIFPFTIDLGLNIQARYVFGGFVKGSAFCKFGIITRNREIMFRSVSIREFNGAGQSVVIDMKWVQRMYWFPKIEGSRLLIECNVTDSNSIKIVTAINKKTVFSRTPYVVDFERSPGYFKPNLPYFLQADLRRLTGDPAPGGNPVTVTVADRSGRNIPGTRDRAITDASGSFALNLNMKSQSGGRMIKVTIDGSDSRVFDILLRRDDSSRDRFISITPNTTRLPLKVGNNGYFMVHASHPREVKTLHYAIISKGVIHYHNTLGFSQGRKFQINIDRSYVPVVSIMVFYASSSAGLVSDTLSLEVQYNCDRGDMFTTNKNKYGPGEKMTLTITGPPQTYFALMAVDQSVYYLRNRSRLTSNKMLRVITRDVVKQNELSSARDAMDQTSVEVFGSSGPVFRPATRSMRGAQPQGRRVQRFPRRRVTRDAESGDEEIGANIEAAPAISEGYYYYDYPYEDDEIYESGEDKESVTEIPMLESNETKVQEENETKIEEEAEEMTLEQCCDKAELEDVANCQAAAMTLTEADVSPECIHSFYNCCIRQQKPVDDDVGRIVLGMSHLHPRRHPILKHKKGLRTTPKMKYKNFRLFKSGPYRVITDSEEKDIFEISSARRTGVVRRHFPESWMFDVYQIGHHSSRKQTDYIVPDSITKWDLQAITLHHQTGLCVLNPRTIRAAKDIFMIVDMPYEAVRTEQFEVKVTIHNKYSERITADLYIIGVPGICTDTIPGNRSKKVTVSLFPNNQEHTSWAISSSKVGKHKIRFELHARPYSKFSQDPKLVDAVMKPLHIIAEGVERIRNIRSFIIDPGKVVSSLSSVKNAIQTEYIKIQTPTDAIPGSVEAVIKVNGDLMGRAVETVAGDLKQLLRQPLASGEQTMMNVGPVLYTAKYLKKTGQLTLNLRRKARKRIKMGVQHMLTFRKKDGSFSIWTRANASTWLSAYVLKMFSESQEFGALSGDPSRILCSASKWLAKQQENDGSFREISPFSTHQVTTKDDIEGTVALTAFATVALESVECGYRNVIQNGLRYLQGKLPLLRHKPYPLSLTAYAFSVSRHGAQQQSDELLWNEGIMRCAGNSGCYWPANRSKNNLRKPTWYKKPKAIEVETASYALMSYIEQKNYPKANKIAKWLVEQRNDKGAFVSTQDTMLALEALSMFSTKTRRRQIDLQVILSAVKNPQFRKHIHITQENALIHQHVEISNHVDGELIVKGRGTGVGQAHIHLKYHSRRDDAVDSCRFDLSVKAVERRLSWEDLLRSMDRRRRSSRKRQYPPRPRSRRLAPSSNYVIELEVCIKYLDTQPTGVAMLEVGLFTGFEPVETQLKALQNNANNHIGRYDVHNRAVHFFMDRIPNQRQICLPFDVRQKHKVGKTQAVAVTVYDLNEPSARCTKFYHPHLQSELRAVVCKNNGECNCRD